MLKISKKFFSFRKLRLESELTSLWWKVRWNEIIFIHNQSDRSLEATKPLYSSFISTAGNDKDIPIGTLIDEQHISTSFSGVKLTTTTESNSAPHTMAHSWRDQKQPNSTDTSGGPNRQKPYIRINDYLQQFSAYRGARAKNAPGGAHGKCHETPSKTTGMLSVHGNHMGMHNDHHKQFHTLAPIPNKGVYKVI